MSRDTEMINFGEIDHFLYVRLHCMCADLDLSVQEFIEEAYQLVTQIIDEKGVTHFSQLAQEYKDYAEYRDMTRYAPRMIEKSHPLVVSGIRCGIRDHLAVIKDENNFPWIVVLRVLLMAMQNEMDKQDRAEWKEGEVKEFVREEFKSRSTVHLTREQPPTHQLEPGTYGIDKTKKRREYEKEAGIYPEREGFRKLDD